MLSDTEGKPECDVLLAQTAVYLARANKNSEVTRAMMRVQEQIKEGGEALPPVPLHLRNASTKLQKQLGYGKGYSFDPDKVRDISYMPEGMEGVDFFDFKK